MMIVIIIIYGRVQSRWMGIMSLEKFTPDQQDQIINQTLFVKKSNIALQEYLIDCISKITHVVTEYHISLPENLEIIQLLEYLKDKNENCQKAGKSMDDLMNKLCVNNNILLEDEIPKKLRWW